MTHIKIGIVDCGGGMKGIYTSGIYDRLLDDKIEINYGIGVSAGAANLITYFAKQKRRTFKFYYDYSFRKQYMSVSNWLKTRSYLDLDYIYTTLTNTDGENPLDYGAFSRSPAEFYAAATTESGEARFFSKDDVALNDYSILKASCAIPAACRPRKIGGVKYFDGGVASPIPYEKAFSDGCTHVILLLTRPKEFRKEKQKNMALIKPFIKKYPAIISLLEKRHILYNDALDKLINLEKSGKALICAPNEDCGVGTLSKNKADLLKLYNLGYEDGKEIENFIKTLDT